MIFVSRQPNLTNDGTIRTKHFWLQFVVYVTEIEGQTEGIIPKFTSPHYLRKLIDSLNGCHKCVTYPINQTAVLRQLPHYNLIAARACQNQNGALDTSFILLLALTGITETESYSRSISSPDLASPKAHVTTPELAKKGPSVAAIRCERCRVI